MDWTSLSSDVISGGAWSGVLPGVPQGGSYFVKVRVSNATSLVATGTHNWFIGIMAIMYGQSNMENMSGTASSPPAANAQTTYWNGSAWGAVPSANGVRGLLNGINSATTVPVAALNGSVAGVPISQLIPGSVIYIALEASLASATASLAEVIFWFQGEGNAEGLYTQEGVYISRENLIHSTLAATTGRTLAQMPMFVAGLATSTVASPNWTQVQRSQIDTNAPASSIYYSHTNVDATLVDSFHWDGASYGRAAARYVQSYSFVLGLGGGLPAWFISGAAVVDATHTDVTVVHSQGTDFTPTSGISGFLISTDNFITSAAPSAAVRQSATVIRLTHSSVGNTRQLMYLGGHAPDISALVKDNSSIKQPLNPSAGNIIVSGAGQLPVPTYQSEARAFNVTGNTWTASGIATGPAFSTRLLVGVITGVYSAAANSMTITPNSGSPVSATIVNAGTGAAIFQAVVTGGQYADFAATFASAIFNSPSISVWYVDTATMLSTIALSTVVAAATAATTVSGALTATSAGGFVITGVSSNNFGASNNSTTGIASGAETYATRPNSGSQASDQSTADASSTSLSVSNSITWTYLASGNMKMAAAAWR